MMPRCGIIRLRPSGRESGAEFVTGLQRSTTPTQRTACASELICVVDDDEGIRTSLDSLLRSVGYAVRTFARPEEFLDYAEDAACLVIDFQLKDADGLALRDRLLMSKHLPIIMITGHDDVAMSALATEGRPVRVLTKPFTESQIMSAVAQAVEQFRGLRAGVQKAADLRER